MSHVNAIMEWMEEDKALLLTKCSKYASDVTTLYGKRSPRDAALKKIAKLIPVSGRRSF
jgi:hypothetical protein